MANIFTPEKVIRYAETRLFGKNVGPDDVRSIELHNGTLPSELEKRLLENHPGFVRVVQTNGREPIYFNEGTLFIPQYSSFERGRRYEIMIEKYIDASGKKIDPKISEAEGNERVTYIEYDNNAYDFVVGLFVPDEKYEDRRVFAARTVADISKIILGPLEGVAKQARVLEKGSSEYLDAQIVEVDGEKVLNLGYVYGGQGGLIISKMMREYAALAKKQGSHQKIDVLMFGRVGGLLDRMKRHDHIFPTGIMDWIQMKQGCRMIHPMNNALRPDTPYYQNTDALILNVQSVLDETRDQLEKARDAGCVAVEMEERDLVAAIDQAQRRHDDCLEIRFGFDGHISDVPLLGDTLDEELESHRGEQEAVRNIIKQISQSH